MRLLPALTRRATWGVLLLCVFAAPRSALRAQGEPPSAERARVEQQVRQRIARIVQDRLQLSDAQMQRLQQTNRRFEEQRRALLRQEREVRVSLREQLASGDRADQSRVGALIDSAIDLQRRRLDLLRDEQRELAGFLTPVQRARYLDLQEKLRRRVEELRRRGAQGGGGGGGRRPLSRRGAPGA